MGACCFKSDMRHDFSSRPDRNLGVRTKAKLFVAFGGL